jgi:Concanavalin A-like lectin/glucanases superfamily
MSLVKLSIPACGTALWLCLSPARGLAEAPASVTWTFDRLDRIGGHLTIVEGSPKVIETPVGKAVLFDGVDDALFIDNHPLAGAKTFTFEAIVRPDGGDFEQRWFHLAERDAKTGQVTSFDPATRADTNARFLFELRVVGSQWYLDAFVNGPGYSRALMVQDKRHPLGRWYHVAQVYDGAEYRSYVNGALQAKAEISFKPQGPGSAAVGVRLNRVNYFKGAVRQARFTPRALPSAEFVKVPEP